MKWFTPAITICCVAQAEAAPTMEDIRRQSDLVTILLQRYQMVFDNRLEYESEAAAALQQSRVFADLSIRYAEGGQDQLAYQYAALSRERLAASGEADRLACQALYEESILRDDYMFEYEKLQRMIFEAGVQ